MKCSGKPDMSVIESKNNDHIVIFQDKEGDFEKDGFLGNVLSELLMV